MDLINICKKITVRIIRRPPAKAQTAFEFLLKYAAAFVFIVIVLGVLFVVFSKTGPINYIPSQCTISSFFLCQGALMAENSTNISFVLQFTNLEGIGFASAVAFPENAITVTATNVGLEGTNSFTGTCNKMYALYGSQVYCHVILPNKAHNFNNSQAYILFSMRYKICSYNTTLKFLYDCSTNSSIGGSASLKITNAANNLKYIQNYYYAPITLRNNQPIPAPAPFQQMLVVNSSRYAQYEAGNLHNVFFFYAKNMTTIPSWLAAGNSNLSSNTVYWLKLASGIPASSEINITMGFAPRNESSFSAISGEAPQLSPSYGEYDNGAMVFLKYSNFNASTAGWQPGILYGAYMPGFISGSPGSINMLNNIPDEATYLVAGNGGIAPMPVIIDSMWSYNCAASPCGAGWTVSAFGNTKKITLFNIMPYNTSSNPAYNVLPYNAVVSSSGPVPLNSTYLGDAFEYLPGGQEIPYSAIAQNSSVANAIMFDNQSSHNVFTYFAVNPAAKSASAGWVNTGNIIPISNFSDEAGVPASQAIANAVLAQQGRYRGLVVSAYSGEYPSTINLYWLIARAYPPNGVMPSAAFGNAGT
ncbi:MAG: hypothetical protein M1331_03155 [Candidatus Marsarchaeota archaeon]|nr:hypothetical protein [Candidatus Marsarchaeota archaeon]